ncbi:MAG TPA: diguanylate cyclase, partial [Bacillota bacterium]|nr:diguanylate cyclase [Bacillota bacterium]
MEVLYRIQVNIVTFIILSVVFIIAYRSLDKSDSLNKSFLLTTIGVMLGLLSETATVILNNNAVPFAIVMNQIFSVLIFAIAPMISFYFFVFIFHLVLPGKKLHHWLWLIFALPIISNIIFAMLSPFFGFFFSISSQGVYARGPLFWLSALSTYIFLAAGIVLVSFNFKRMVSKDFWLILGIGIIPIVGGIVQGLVYGLLAMWGFAAIGLFLGYLFLQDRMIRLDYMTSAWNRESFYYTYSRRIQMTPEKKFGAIYLDIDNLKIINDSFGHLEGDKAIALVMDVIREVLPYGAVIARLGGDEFIVLYDCETMEEMQSILGLIKKNFLENEKVKAKEYQLECSFGVSLFTSEFASLEAFLSHLDGLMYQE